MFQVYWRIIPEALDIQMILQILYLVFSKWTIQELTNFVDNTLHICLHIFIEDEQKIGMFFVGPSLVDMLKVILKQYSNHQQII